MEDVDEGPKGDHELFLGERYMFSGALIILVLVTTVPLPSGVAPHLQEHIPILLVIPSNLIPCTVGHQSELPHYGVTLGLADQVVLILIRCTDA